MQRRLSKARDLSNLGAGEKGRGSVEKVKRQQEEEEEEVIRGEGDWSSGREGDKKRVRQQRGEELRRRIQTKEQ